MFRYTAGKADWFAAGWPREGEPGAGPFINSLMDTRVVRCGPGDTVGDVRRRVDAAGADRCVVVNARGVVLGLLDGERLAADARLTADLAMRLGPSTFRPSVPAAEMAEYLRGKSIRSVLVTTSDGELLGALDREAVEHAAGSRLRSWSLPGDRVRPGSPRRREFCASDLLPRLRR